jgi:hypothetical protein
MTIMTRRMICAAVFGAVFAASLAAAEAQQMAQTPPVRIRGTIEKVDGSTLTIKARDGQTMQVELADNPTIRTVVKKTVADVKQGLFVGITAMPQPDGTQKAAEIHRADTEKISRRTLARLLRLSNEIHRAFFS